MYTFGDKIDFDFVANIRDKNDRVEVDFVTNVYEALKTIIYNTTSEEAIVKHITNKYTSL